MSIEKNKALVRRLWEEVWNQNNLAVCDEIFDEAYAEHEKRFAPIMKTAFPDLHFTIEDMIAEHDKVVTRLTLTGTHQGEFMGVAATGNAIKVTSTWIHRVFDNRIVEGREWGEFDRLSLLEQLGKSMDDPQNTTKLPAPSLLPMITGFWTSQAIYVAAKLGIADLLQDEPKSSEELAVATGASQRELFRLLRFLSSQDIFAEDGEGRFQLTPLAMGLQTDVPGSLNGMAVMYGEEIYQAWGQLYHSIRTGETAFEHLYKSGHFHYLERHPDAANVYNQAMAGFSMRETAAILDAYDFSRFGQIVDVGGGQGSLLASILEANPALSGVLFDLPEVVAHASESLVTDYQDRCEIIGGDFLASVPSGGDLYLIKNILLNWDDEQCVTILKNGRSAMGDNGKLLVIEAVIPAGNEPSFSKLLDLHMMVVTGGQGRTESEFRTLFAAAGFKLTSIIPTKSPTSLIEGIPTSY